MSEPVILANTLPCEDMASGDDKQEEEEFEDLPSEVEGDASEVGNTSTQEKFDKHTRRLSKKAPRTMGREAKKRTRRKRKKKKRRKRTTSKKRRRKEEKKRTPSPSSSSSSSSSSNENGDVDDEYYGIRIPKRTLKPNSKPKAKSKHDYRSVSFNYDSLETNSKEDITIPIGKLPQFDGDNFAKWKHMMKAYLTSLSLKL
jgi:hypothetical protein